MFEPWRLNHVDIPRDRVLSPWIRPDYLTWGRKGAPVSVSMDCEERFFSRKIKFHSGHFEDGAVSLP